MDSWPTDKLYIFFDITSLGVKIRSFLDNSFVQDAILMSLSLILLSLVLETVRVWGRPRL